MPSAETVPDTFSQASEGAPGHAGQTLADLTRRGPGGIAGERAVTLTDIELELATIVAEDPSLWEFAHLTSLCRDLLSSAHPTAGEHEVEALLEKISRFERIREMKQALTGRPPAGPDAPAAAAWAPSGAAEPRADGEEALATPRDIMPSRDNRETGVTWRALRNEDAENEAAPVSTRGEVVRIPDSPVEPAVDPGRYDGIGTLRPVVSRRREAPRFALVDPEGDVVTFITPSPGVNLQPYVGQRIGVVGTRGYMPEFQRTHVTAARVTPLR